MLLFGVIEAIVCLQLSLGWCVKVFTINKTVYTIINFFICESMLGWEVKRKVNSEVNSFRSTKYNSQVRYCSATRMMEPCISCIQIGVMIHKNEKENWRQIRIYKIFNFTLEKNTTTLHFYMIQSDINMRFKIIKSTKYTQEKRFNDMKSNAFISLYLHLLSFHLFIYA